MSLYHKGIHPLDEETPLGPSTGASAGELDPIRRELQVGSIRWQPLPQSGDAHLYRPHTALPRMIHLDYTHKLLTSLLLVAGLLLLLGKNPGRLLKAAEHHAGAR